jgi:mono/diheme cytochrome c family protein
VCSVWAGNAERGKAIYGSNCVACHGKRRGRKGPGGAVDAAGTDRTSPQRTGGRKRPTTRSPRWIKDGRAARRWWRFSKLSEEELDDLVAYMKQLSKDAAR